MAIGSWGVRQSSGSTTARCPRNSLLVADLYRLSAENRDFLHARFSLGEDPLEPYKTTIEDAVYL